MKIKLAIIIPLKSKAVSKDWELVQQNLLRTIKSITNQVSNNFCLVIVGHECPEYMAEISKQYNNITFITLSEFAPPRIENASDTSARQLMFDTDKSFKILKGCMYLKQEDPSISHWFSMDADDLLHQDFVSELENSVDIENANDAVILDNGYFYYEKYGVFNKSRVFSQFCGSSSILGTNLLDIPSELKPENLNKILFNKVSHTQMLNYLVTNKIKFQVPNKKLVMYIRDNGENISAGKNEYIYRIKRYLKMKVRSVYLGPNEKKKFGL